MTDTTAPVLHAPADRTVECRDCLTGGTVVLPTATGTPDTPTDNCDPAPVVTYADSVAAACGNSKVITRTWTATDACGNSASATQTITVTDTTAPTLSVASQSIVVECSAPTTPAALGFATASDSCDPNVSVRYDDTTVLGRCTGEVSIARRWTGTDACQNSGWLTQSIAVRDTTAPVLSVPADKTVECGASTASTATATDTCDAQPKITSTTVVVPGSCAGSQVVRRTFTAKDKCGNEASGTQQITVADTTPPAITNAGQPVCVYPPNKKY